MNEHIRASDANRQFSQLLQRVGKGESFVITSHGKPVAEIRPVEDDTEKDRKRAARERLFARLDSQPVTNIGKWTRDELYDD